MLLSSQITPDATNRRETQSNSAGMAITCDVNRLSIPTHGAEHNHNGAFAKTTKEIVSGQEIAPAEISERFPAISISHWMSREKSTD
jgi:hypothetical protein